MIDPVQIVPCTPDHLGACVAILEDMHRQEGYPATWPVTPGDWVAPEREIAAWVAIAADGAMLGHVGLHRVAPGHAGCVEWCAAADRPPGRLGSWPGCLSPGRPAVSVSAPSS
jgi:hypothetical protein